MIWNRTLLLLCIPSSLSAQVQWTPLATVTSPGERQSLAMTFDEARGETLLFGGYDSTGTMDGDTWAFDGIDWQLRATTGPAPRFNHTMVFDPNRLEVVMFGGNFAGGAQTNETWTWDGTQWTLRAPTTPPPPRAYHAMAFDAGLGGVVVHGGYSQNAMTNELWLWNGQDWADLTTPDSPTLAQHVAAYHVGQSRLVVYGGYREVLENATTWIFDGSEWQSLDPTSPPYHRLNAEMVYDPHRDRLILYGGASAPFETYPPSVWQWNGVWSDLEPGASVGGLETFGMAYDTVRDRAVVFGGFIGGFYTSATLDETSELSPTSPAAPFAEAKVRGFGFSLACETPSDGLFLPGGKAFLTTGGERPWIDEDFDLFASPIGGSFAPSSAALFFGASDQSWSGVPLPLPLTALGRPDCLIYVSVDATLPVTATVSAVWNLPIPNCPSCVGTTHFAQVVGVQLGELLTSNALEFTIGQR